eukprot:g56756.t1
MTALFPPGFGSTAQPQQTRGKSMRRAPDFTINPLDFERRPGDYLLTRPICLYFTGNHYQSLLNNPDFWEPLGSGPDTVTGASAMEAKQLNEQAADAEAGAKKQLELPDWVCDFCTARNSSAATVTKCKACQVRRPPPPSSPSSPSSPSPVKDILGLDEALTSHLLFRFPVHTSSSHSSRRAASFIQTQIA